MSERYFPGRFVAIEGPDGAGKTTVWSKLVAHVRGLGGDVVGTRQPGGIDQTFPIRQQILHPANAGDGMTQLLLFVTDRRLHLKHQIIPALLDGQLVICDRFFGSTWAYQGAGGIPLRTIIDFDTRAKTFEIDGRKVTVEPDLTVLIDAPPEVGMARIAGRNGQVVTHFDAADVEIHAARREIYQKMAVFFGWVVIDGTQGEDQVYLDVLTTLDKRGFLTK